MLWLGKISYSLYLVHPFALDPIRAIVRRLNGTALSSFRGALFVVVGAGAALALSALSYHFVEHRLTRLLFARKTPHHQLPTINR